MYSNMLLEISILVEALLTVWTVVWFCPLMPSHVRHQAGSVLKLLTALIAEKLTVLHVNRLVRGQIALRFERLVTLVTNETPFTCVRLHVSRQQVSYFEGLVAAVVRAGVHLPVVSGEPVVGKAGGSAEMPTAAGLPAGEHLSSLLLLLLLRLQRSLTFLMQFLDQQ